MTNRRRSPILWTPAGNEGVYAAATLFRARQGHGFAAERANHLTDAIYGNTVELVGRGNVKNGPDRIVNGESIRTKYHHSANRGITNCFHKGRYRYTTPTGHSCPSRFPATSTTPH